MYRPWSPDGPLQYSNLKTQAPIEQLPSLGVNVKWNEKLNFAIQVIQGQFLLYDHSISSHLVAKPNSQESKPFKQRKIQVILLEMHAYKLQITRCPLHMHIIDSHIVLISSPSLFASPPRLSWGFSTLFLLSWHLLFFWVSNHTMLLGFLKDCACSPFSQKNHQPVFSLSFFKNKNKKIWMVFFMAERCTWSLKNLLLVLWGKDPPMVRGGGS